jgi:hypothetical protein
VVPYPWGYTDLAALKDALAKYDAEASNVASGNPMATQDFLDQLKPTGVNTN